MNSLSWFLYAVDVIDNMHDILAAILIITLSIYAICFIMGGINEMDNYKAEKDPFFKKVLSYFPKVTVSIVCGTILLAALPSQKTMYLILGSEVGEQAINSETGKRVQDAINKKLDEYLKEPK